MIIEALNVPATLMSQASAISRPPPRAAPSMAAIVGMGRLPKKSVIKNRLLTF